MWAPVWARERCRISPPRFLVECCKRQLNQGSFVLLYFRLFTFSDLYWVCLSVFSCTVLFVNISQVIGCEDRLRNDLYCVEWGVELYSNQPTLLMNVTHEWLKCQCTKFILVSYKKLTTGPVAPSSVNCKQSCNSVLLSWQGRLSDMSASSSVGTRVC